MNKGGVGFDINCGVRLIRTNLLEEDIQPVKEQLAQVCMCVYMCMYVRMCVYICMYV